MSRSSVRLCAEERDTEAGAKFIRVIHRQLSLKKESQARMMMLACLVFKNECEPGDNGPRLDSIVDLQQIAFEERTVHPS